MVIGACLCTNEVAYRRLQKENAENPPVPTQIISSVLKMKTASYL